MSNSCTESLRTHFSDDFMNFANWEWKNMIEGNSVKTQLMSEKKKK